jgi:hypothetical protein
MAGLPFFILCPFVAAVLLIKLAETTGTHGDLDKKSRVLD